MKTATAFLMGVVFAFSIAAASQYDYEKPISIRKPITPARAAQYLAMYKEDGAWPTDAPVSWLRHCVAVRVQVSEDFPDGLAVECNGTESGTVPADMLPEGAKVTNVLN